jgi:hypothetical protein
VDVGVSLTSPTNSTNPCVLTNLRSDPRLFTILTPNKLNKLYELYKLQERQGSREIGGRSVDT